MVQLLEPGELVILQALNRYFYIIGVPRVNGKLALKYSFEFDEGQDTWNILVVKAWVRKMQKPYLERNQNPPIVRSIFYDQLQNNYVAASG